MLKNSFLKYWACFQNSLWVHGLFNRLVDYFFYGSVFMDTLCWSSIRQPNILIHCLRLYSLLCVKWRYKEVTNSDLIAWFKLSTWPGRSFFRSNLAENIERIHEKKMEVLLCQSVQEWWPMFRYILAILQ